MFEAPSDYEAFLEHCCHRASAASGGCDGSDLAVRCGMLRHSVLATGESRKHVRLLLDRHFELQLPHWQAIAAFECRKLLSP